MKRFGLQLFAQLFDHAVRVCTGAVHLVDEGNARNLVSLHLAVNRDRLALHATDATEHQHRTVENAQ